MTLVLNGTTGVSAVDGSASTPAIQGNDTNTGVFFPAADTVAMATGGSERVRVDSSGNVGVGTSSPVTRLDVSGIATVRNNSAAFNTTPNTNYGLNFQASSSGVTYITSYSSGGSTAIAFATNSGGGAAAERARIDESGNLLVGTTSVINGSNAIGQFLNVNGGRPGIAVGNTSGSSATNAIIFINSNGTVGSIQTSASSTSYVTSSDYRLKHDIAPMTGALAKVAALKPVTYKWNADDSEGEGFIAHELVEVCPDAVTGEKDAVDADGNPVYQGIDTSFLVATLTAAIQELNAKVESLTAEIATLKGAQA